MTDKELLEAAAKAAGIEGEHRTENLCVGGDWMDVTAIFFADGMGWWNPLNDDGDALRLAVKLNLNLRFGAQWVLVHNSEVEASQSLSEDPCAATRRAVVRAAAELAAARAVGAA